MNLDSSTRKILLLLLFLLPLTAALAYWIGRSSRGNLLPSPAALAQQAQEESRRRVDAGPQSPPTGGEANESSTPGKESMREVCAESWRLVAGSDAETLELDLLRQARLLSSACLERMLREAGAGNILTFLNRCQARLPELSEEEIGTLCLPLLEEFRAFVSWRLHQNADPAAFSYGELAGQLQGALQNLEAAGPEGLDQALLLASEMLRFNPDSYQAYKAQLLLTLLQEIKFGREVERGTYDRLYGQLMEFEHEGDDDRIASAARGIGANAEPLELTGLDRDLIHIPFLRAAALGDYEAVTAMAEEYIAAYPNSYIGYYYLAEAAWQSGEREEALALFRQGIGSQASAEAALELFQRLQSQSPLERLYGMGTR